MREAMIPYKEEDWEGVLRDIRRELSRACVKHRAWPSDGIHAAAIVAEEAGELVQAALQKRYEGLDDDRDVSEAIQTAAMAIRLLLEEIK
jgi:hypothetical protein